MLEEEEEEEAEEEEEEEEEYDGWDGRLQETSESDDNIFHPSQRKGPFSLSKPHAVNNSDTGKGAIAHRGGDTPTITASEGLKLPERQPTPDNMELHGHNVLELQHDIMSAHQRRESTVFADELRESHDTSSTHVLGMKPPSLAELTRVSLDKECSPSDMSSEAGNTWSSSTLSHLEQDSCLSVHTPKSAKTLVPGKKWRLQEGEDNGSTTQLLPLQPAPESTAVSNRSGGRYRKRNSVECVKLSSTAQGSKPASFKSVESIDGHTRKPIPAQEDDSLRQKGAPGVVGGSASSAVSSSFSSNSVSDNFVRLNLKVKRFSRKRGGLTGSAYKRRMWKKYQKGQSGASFRGGGGGRGSGVCFKCGKPGHWAKECTEREGSKNLGSFAGEKVQFSDGMGLEHMEELDSDTLQRLAQESPFPSTREAAVMARGVGLEQSRQAQAETAVEPEEPFVALPPCSVRPPSPPPPMEPLFPSDTGDVQGRVQ